MIGVDLSTKAGVLAFCESRRAEMVRSFERVGRFECNGYSFAGYLFATHAIAAPKGDRGNPDAWKTGSRLARVEARECRMPAEFLSRIPPQRHTEAFAHVMRLYAQITRSIGSLFMGETWMVTGADDGKTAEQVRAELPANLEDAPGRIEALFMNLEHTATGRRTWCAEIKREPDRVAPWHEPYAEKDSDMVGRLTDLAEWRS